MSQRGQLIQLKSTGRDGEVTWAFRYRVGGRDSKRVQRGGFASERDAAEALDRELERLLREQRVSRSLTLAELVEAYLEQHDVDPVTIDKLRWLLGKAVAVFGERRVGDLRAEEIAAWRIALSPGYRFDATQALRQVLARALLWGMIDVNPAKLGVDNPSPRRREQRPFESWAELHAVAANLASRYRQMVIFAAATGLRPAEWLALEWRDLDLEARVVYVHRSFTKGRLKCPKTETSRRAVPLQTIALEAIEQQPARRQSAPCVPRRAGRLPRPAQLPQPRVESLPSARQGSNHRAGSTIYGTRLRPSHYAPGSRPSTFPATWRQPDDDRPPLRPPRPRRTRACDPPARRAERRRTSTVDVGGRRVDTKFRGRHQQRQRKHGLSRQKVEALFRTRTVDP
jgi:integrase